MRSVISRWSAFVAVLIFAGGVCAAVWGGMKLNRRMEDIRDAQQLLARLQSLEGKLDSIGRAKAHLDSLDGSTPVDLDILLGESGLDAAVTDSDSRVSSLDDGWSVITRRIVFNDVILTDLDAFAVKCHQARPPWVLTEISLISSPFESGRAKATVTLQALRSKTQ